MGTDRWNLSTLGPGDRLSDDGYKFTDADRRLIDRLLKYAAEDHHHTGEAGEDLAPAAGPNLTLSATGGAIPSGVRYFYKHTVVDESDNESAGSPATSVQMPAQLQEPGAPALAWVTGSGTLEPGTYTYVLSAYKDVSTLETKAIRSAVITIAGSSATNEITLDLPALPAGATGFNIYRRSPTGVHFLWLDSTTSSSYIDDGSSDGDCDRTLPSVNRSGNTNKVTVVFPGATPAIPDGWSWRIYRTDDPNNWNNSFLTELVPPNTPISFVDVGGATAVGAPPQQSQVINAPEKIRLTNGAEVQGTLPPGKNVVPKVVTFALPGPVVEGPGSFIWVCDFDQADIIGVRAYLGVDSSPDVQDVIVDVNAYRPGEATPTWQSIFLEVQDDMPHVPVGLTIGEQVVPIVQHLTLGDALQVDVDQAGGGAGTDANLIVSVFMYAQAGSTTTSYNWTV